MYSERKDSFSIKTVIVQFLFVALFIFLLMWLFPTKNYVNNLEGGETTDLTVFYDRIFNENVIAMKDAAKSYFTTPRLPQNVGDKVTITLGEMLEKKIILPFVDSEGKQCSLTDSYVEVTKYDAEFVMKVNLKCSEQENYLLVYMGCYDYCSTTICEKNEADVKTPVVYPVKQEQKQEQTQEQTPVVQQPVINNIVNNNITNTIINNTNITVIQPVPTPEPPPTPEPDVPEIEIPESTPSCTLKVVSGEKSGDVYVGQVVVGFASKSAGKNATLTGFGLGNKEIYNNSSTYSLAIPGTYKVYGYVKNSFGNTNTCSIDVTIINKPEEVKEYEYEYTKSTTTCSDYSDWSAWSTTKYESTAEQQVAWRKVKKTVITGYDVTTTNDTSKPIYATREVVIGTLNQTRCTEYDYTATGEIAYGDWEYKGEFVYNGNLKATDLTKYERVTRDAEYCKDHCSFTTDTIYKVWERKVISGAVYTCKNTVTTKKLLTAQEKYISGYEKITTKTPITKTYEEMQYRYRTRTCDTKVDTKWSSYDDKKLLDAGYKYTGKSREKSK